MKKKSVSDEENKVLIDNAETELAEEYVNSFESIDEEETIENTDDALIDSDEKQESCEEKVEDMQGEETEEQEEKTSEEKQPEPAHKKRRNPLRTLILIIAIGCFIYSGGYLLTNLVIIPYMNQKSYDDIRNLNTNENTDVAASNGVWKDTEEEKEKIERDENGVIISLSEAAKKYPDLKGWIQVPGTRINYPIVQSPDSKDNEYYLYRGIDGKKNPNGTIFFDISNDISSIESKNKNLLIYGHHMKSGEMFADLMKYATLDFYKQSPVIRMDTIYQPGLWVVISVMKCNSLESQGVPFNYTRTVFADDEDFEKFISDVKARSLIDTPYTATAEDEIVTIQTCSYEFKGFRTVVVARRLKENEGEIDVSTASMAKNPIMPDIWYR